MTDRIRRFLRRHQKSAKAALVILVLPSFLLLSGCGSDTEASDIPQEPPKSPYQLEDMINNVKTDIKKIKLDVKELVATTEGLEDNSDAIDTIMADIDDILSRLSAVESATPTPTPTSTGVAYPTPTSTTITPPVYPTATPTSTSEPTPTYSLSLGSTTGGIVCKPQFPVTYYPYGEIVWVEAISTIEGYSFDKWIGEASISNRSASETAVFMYDDWVLTATFVLNGS